MITEEHKELLQQIEHYVTNEEKKDINNLILKLLETFPNYRYHGLAYRAIRGEWNPSIINNFSFSIDFESSIEACESFSDQKGDIFVYQALVDGFDLDLFITHIRQAQSYEFSGNFFSFALKEKEILVYHYTNLELSERIKKIF